MGFWGIFMKKKLMFLLCGVIGLNLYGAQSKRGVSPLTDPVFGLVLTQPVSPEPSKLTSVLLDQLQADLANEALVARLTDDEKKRNCIPTVASLLVHNGISLYQKQVIHSLFLRNQKVADSHFCDARLQYIFNRQEVAMHIINNRQQKLIDEKENSKNLRLEIAKAYEAAYWHGIMFQREIKKTQ